jgi:hypothetical protein
VSVQCRTDRAETAAPEDAARHAPEAHGRAAGGGDSPETLRYKACTKPEETMIYELRVYRCLPGRLPALLNRFQNTTLKLWDKHGIKQAGFFTTLIGESNQELTYLLVWDSMADRETKWNAFQYDPDWISARAKTEERGQIVGNIVSQLLAPTTFSALK